MPKTSLDPSQDTASKVIIPAILSAAFKEPPNIVEIKQIILAGLKEGLPMPQIYARRAETAKKRGVNVPPFEKVMGDK